MSNSKSKMFVKLEKVLTIRPHISVGDIWCKLAHYGYNPWQYDIKYIVKVSNQRSSHGYVGYRVWGHTFFIPCTNLCGLCNKGYYLRHWHT